MINSHDRVDLLILIVTTELKSQCVFSLGYILQN
jgi:hypothetical protein